MKELITELQEELQRSGIIRVVSLRINGVNGNQNYIEIQGRVTTYYQKQMIQEICLRKLQDSSVTLRNEIVVD